MSAVLYCINLFQLDKLYIFLFILCLVTILYFFLSTNSLFFRLLLTLGFVILNSILLAFFSLDFFSGFLLTAELPILLVAILFFFQKNSLGFDSVYDYNPRTKSWALVSCFFLVVLFILCFKNPATTRVFYEFSLFDSIFISHRNDFFLYYQIYYVLYPSFVLFIGLIVFLVSYLVILVYYAALSLTKATTKQAKNISFIRKQNFLRQSIYANKLSFFKKK